MPTVDPNVCTVQEAERLKFKTGDSGEICVRTCIDGDIETTPGGGGVSSGLTTDVTISEFSWTALPTTALVGRVGFSVQNQTIFEIKINFGTPAGYVGVIVGAGSERFYNANDAATLYAKAEAGAGATLSGILVEELKP